MSEKPEHAARLYFSERQLYERSGAEVRSVLDRLFRLWAHAAVAERDRESLRRELVGLIEVVEWAWPFVATSHQPGLRAASDAARQRLAALSQEPAP